MNKHIIIAGARQVGKSTLVNRLLENYKGPLYGFRTAAGHSITEGYRSFYMHPAGHTGRFETADNCIGESNGKTRSNYPAVFDSFGLQCLDAADDGIILMDELGFMELEAHCFCERVLELLGGDIPVIATAKAGYDCDFLNAVLNHPNADIYYIDKENRDELYETLKRSWNEFVGGTGWRAE